MNLSRQINTEEKFCWNNIVEKVVDTFRMDYKEEEKFRKNKVAKLIGAIPFLAGCNQPERVSLSNLCTYIIAMKGGKSVFNHDSEDDGLLMNRLSSISYFDGGDADIIEKGMSLLALNMLHGYRRDVEKDSDLGKYNPVSANAWDYHSEVKQLTTIARSVDCHEMEMIMQVEDTVFTYWSYT